MDNEDVLERWRRKTYRKVGEERHTGKIDNESVLERWNEIWRMKACDGTYIRKLELKIENEGKKR